MRVTQKGLSDTRAFLNRHCIRMWQSSRLRPQFQWARPISDLFVYHHRVDPPTLAKLPLLSDGEVSRKMDPSQTPSRRSQSRSGTTRCARRLTDLLLLGGSSLICCVQDKRGRIHAVVTPAVPCRLEVAPPGPKSESLAGESVVESLTIPECIPGSQN